MHFPILLHVTVLRLFYETITNVTFQGHVHVSDRIQI